MTRLIPSTLLLPRPIEVHPHEPARTNIPDKLSIKMIVAAPQKVVRVGGKGRVKYLYSTDV